MKNKKKDDPNILRIALGVGFVVAVVIALLLFAMNRTKPDLSQVGKQAVSEHLRSLEIKAKKNYDDGKRLEEKGRLIQAESAYHLGMIAEKNFNYIKAKEWYQKALAVDPKHQKAKDGLAEIDKIPGVDK